SRFAQKHSGLKCLLPSASRVKFGWQFGRALEAALPVVAAVATVGAVAAPAVPLFAAAGAVAAAAGDAGAASDAAPPAAPEAVVAPTCDPYACSAAFELPWRPVPVPGDATGVGAKCPPGGGCSGATPAPSPGAVPPG